MLYSTTSALLMHWQKAKKDHASSRISLKEPGMMHMHLLFFTHDECEPEYSDAAWPPPRRPGSVATFRLMDHAIKHHHREDGRQIHIGVPEERARPLFVVFAPETNGQVDQPAAQEQRPDQVDISH